MKLVCLAVLVVSTFVAVALTGCGGSSAADANSQGVTPVSIDGSKYVLADEPDGALGVIAARQSAHDGEPIVIVGRIGGAVDPWIEGRAAFLLIDASKSVVAEGTESGGDELCAGDCCALERAACTTLVKVVDEGGRVLTVDSRQLLGVAANDMVVVRGQASKDDSGNFVVLADGVHVRR
jgi:hypothetical protein